MQTRRRWMRAAVSGVVALAVVAGSVLAEEMFATIKEVKPETQKIVVIEKGNGLEHDLTVKEGAVIETAKGKTIPLEKLKANAKVQLTHTGGVVTKIVVKGGAGKKKGEPQGDRP